MMTSNLGDIFGVFLCLKLLNFHFAHNQKYNKKLKCEGFLVRCHQIVKFSLFYESQNPGAGLSGEFVSVLGGYGFGDFSR